MSHRFRDRSILILHFTLFSILGVEAVGPAFALPIAYNDNCAGQIPTNQGSRWFGSCPDPTYGETNWQGNVLPTSIDDAVIGVEFGPILVDGPNATALSVQAPGGLILDFSAYSLVLSGGESNITGLQLTNNAAIFSDGDVYLDGVTHLGADIHGPGFYFGSGDLNLNNCRLWDNAFLFLDGPASLTAGQILLSTGNTRLVSNDVFTVGGSASGIQGTGVQGSGTFFRLTNGVMNVTVPGNTFDISTSMDIAIGQEAAAELNVLAGTVELSGGSKQLGGSATVAGGATLRLTGTTGADQNRFWGIGLSGEGLVDVYVDCEVALETVLDVGTGTPAAGAGGFRLQSTLDVQESVLNRGRFRFNSGTVSGANQAEILGTFWNQVGGWAYTRSAGSATIESLDALNSGDFELGGAGLALTVSSNFSNQGTFHVIAGGITGDGTFKNENIFRMDATNPATISTISALFQNDSRVLVTAGHLVFENLDNMTGPVLTGGEWIANLPGTIRFPVIVRALSGATLSGPSSAYPNTFFDLLSAKSKMNSSDWNTLTDLLVDDSELTVEAGSPGVTVQGTLTNRGGGTVAVEDGGELQANQIDNGDDDDSVLNDMETIVVLAKSGENRRKAVPAVVTTPLLNNRARILPGSAGTVGEMQLNGNLVQHPTGALLIDLESDVSHDVLTIDGNATLDGRVEVSVAGGYVPPVGQQYTILTTTGTVAGAFDFAVGNDGYTYELIQTSNSVILEVFGPTAAPNSVPHGLALSAPHPNPSNPTAQLSVQGTPGADVEMRVFDLRGSLVQTRSMRLDSTGQALFRFDGRDPRGTILASGVYYVRAQNAEGFATRKVTLLK